MSYYANFGGTITPRGGVTEGAIEIALNEILPGDYSENIENGEIVSYEISGSDKYHDDDFKEIAKTFDGQIDFVGEDDTRWSLFLKDGKVEETTPLEFLPTPGETPEQTIGRCIAKSGLNIRKILEGMPDFIAAKIWTTEDVENKMDELDIDDETQKKLLPEAVKLINKKRLEECDDSEWDAIETAVKKALKEMLFGKEAD